MFDTSKTLVFGEYCKGALDVAPGQFHIPSKLSSLMTLKLDASFYSKTLI